MRKTIRKEIEAVVPFDGLERRMKDQALEWVNSGAELCRIEKPATPLQHLVSYFMLVDGDYLLLVDHISAKELDLPAFTNVLNFSMQGEKPEELSAHEQA